MIVLQVRIYDLFLWHFQLYRQIFIWSEMKNGTHFIAHNEKMTVTWIHSNESTTGFFGVVSLSHSRSICTFSSVYRSDTLLFSRQSLAICTFFEWFSFCYTFFVNCCFMTFEHFKIEKKRKLSLRAGIVIKINANTEKQQQMNADRQCNLKQKKSLPIFLLLLWRLRSLAHSA